MNTTTPDFYIAKIRELMEGQYSMRGFAREVGIDSAYLVHILKGKKPMTPKLAYKVGLYMKLEGEEMLNFLRPTLSEKN